MTSVFPKTSRGRALSRQDTRPRFAGSVCTTVRTKAEGPEWSEKDRNGPKGTG